jgi:hypothetical protein
MQQMHQQHRSTFDGVVWGVGWMDEWMDGWMDGWMGGLVEAEDNGNYLP